MVKSTTYWSGPMESVVEPSTLVVLAVRKTGTRNEAPITRLASPEMRGRSISSLSWRSRPHDARASCLDRSKRPMDVPP